MKFDHLKSIYRNYDIRGKYPEEITDEEVYKIGKALVDIYSPHTVVVGYDNRPSAKPLLEALIKGITEQGADVVNLGLVTTPMLYYASGSTDAGVAVMVTASHMPSDFNGLKICIDDALPIGIDSGLSELRDYVSMGQFKSGKDRGSVSERDIKEEWRAHLRVHAEYARTDGFKHAVVLDPGNAVGVLELETLKQYGDVLEVHSIFDELDHTYPNHEPNPMKLDTLTELSREVVARGANMGIALDGDADRIGIVDENGIPVPQDMIGVIIAEELMRRKGVSPILYDIRSSKRVKEVVESKGGKAVPSRIGHTYIRRGMREHDAVFALELSGHLFFKDTHFSEAGVLPALILLSIMERTSKTLSELVEEHLVYSHSGEINSTVNRTPEDIYTDLKATFPNGVFDHTDGLTITCSDWWCNVRPSANDPVMRLNLEADTQEKRDMRVSEVLAIIRKN